LPLPDLNFWLPDDDLAHFVAAAVEHLPLVAVLGASSFTYACAVWSQALPDWNGAHVRAFGYFGGVARQLVSDNLKAGVTRACFHSRR